eukprot:3073339-Alexandrium_andersonii.AAC.1
MITRQPSNKGGGLRPALLPLLPREKSTGRTVKVQRIRMRNDHCRLPSADAVAPASAKDQPATNGRAKK